MHAVKHNKVCVLTPESFDLDLLSKPIMNPATIELANLINIFQICGVASRTFNELNISSKIHTPLLAILYKILQKNASFVTK